jgi:hypothetical protein
VVREVRQACRASVSASVELLARVCAARAAWPRDSATFCCSSPAQRPLPLRRADDRPRWWLAQRHGGSSRPGLLAQRFDATFLGRGRRRFRGLLLFLGLLSRRIRVPDFTLQEVGGGNGADHERRAGCRDLCAYADVAPRVAETLFDGGDHAQRRLAGGQRRVGFVVQI